MSKALQDIRKEWADRQKIDGCQEVVKTLDEQIGALLAANDSLEKVITKREDSIGLLMEEINHLKSLSTVEDKPKVVKRRVKKQRQGRRTLDWNKVNRIRADFLNGKSIADIARYHKIVYNHAKNVCLNEAWPDPKYHPDTVR